jgi:hypothetical protein
MADRYWVGGAGTWNAANTTNWSDTSGGSGGFSVPTANDDVYFNAASNATNYTVTTSGNNTDMVCRSLNVAAPASGILTFSNTVSTLRIFGSLTHVASNITWGGSITLSFASTATGNTITTNGYSFQGSWVFNGVGGSWQLQDNLTTRDIRTVTLTNGALDLNNQTLSCGLFSSSNSNTRSIAFGTGNITLTGSGAVLWSTSTATNFTISGTPTVNSNYAGSVGTRTFAVGNTTGGTETNSINLNIGTATDAVSLSLNSNVKDLTFTGFTGSATLGYVSWGNLTLSAGMTTTGSGNGIIFSSTSGTKTITTNGVTIERPFTFNGIGGIWQFADALTQGSTRAFTITNGTVKLKAGATSTVGAFATSGSNQKYLQSTAAGSQATLSQASGTVTVSYLTIKDIAATGGATWNAYVDYNNVDQGDNTGWDFSNSPAIDNEFPIALRSFTQPKRF